jgi:predicted nucleic acid-binding protein
MPQRAVDQGASARAAADGSRRGAKRASRDRVGNNYSSFALLLHRAFIIALDLTEPIYDCIYLAAALATDRKLVTADVRFAAKVARLRLPEDPIVLLHLLAT